MIKLKNVSLGQTKVRDIGPLSKLKDLRTLSLEGVQAKSFQPLSDLTSLEGLNLSKTKISDLTPLAGLLSLERLVLNETGVTDLAPLSRLTLLKKLSLNNTRVQDLSPISGKLTLNYLEIENTRVKDLQSIAGMTTLQDGATEAGRTLQGGLSFKGSPVARFSPFNILTKLQQPALTVETINEVRKQLGLSLYTPKGYESDGDNDEDEHLAQRPASHRFFFRNDRIEAASQAVTSRHPDVTNDIRNEVINKAKEALDRLQRANAPPRLISTIDRLSLSLGSSLADLRAGILQMRFRSLEADVAAYDSEDGRRELPEDALSMLRDLASSAEDLMGCFPQLADIEAERLAQRLKDADIPDIIDALSQIRRIAEESEAVAPSAVEALKIGEPELAHDAEIIDSGASELARIAAASARDRTVGYMLLIYRNFISGALIAGGELTELGGDTWRDIRKKAPETFSDAAIAAAIAVLVGALLGPTAALTAFAASFKPLRDRAKRTADRLIDLTKRGRAEKKADE